MQAFRMSSSFKSTVIVAIFIILVVIAPALRQAGDGDQGVGYLAAARCAAIAAATCF